MKEESSPVKNALEILVYEHISGGGYANRDLPIEVLAEGFGMLRSFAADLKRAGHVATVLIDKRIFKLNPPIEASHTIPINNIEEPKRFIADASKSTDAIYIIAPETGLTLQKLVNLAESTGKVSLNCKSDIIGKVSDKSILHTSLQAKGFPTPKTMVLNITDDISEITHAVNQQFSYPVIFKPVDGVGCSGISLVKKSNQIEQALSKIKEASASRSLIVQEFICGDSASISLLSNGEKIVPLSLNRQTVTLSEPDTQSSYDGGCVPFTHPLEKEATILAQNVIKSFSGLRGYVGVDLVLTREKAFVVDVNSRLTTSYVGLRSVVDFNVADALVNTIVSGKLPNRPQCHGFACFSKLEAPVVQSVFQHTATFDNAVSPPFLISGQSKVCALVLGEGSSEAKAVSRLEEAKKKLLNIMC